jgi:hypothetical protein
MCQGGTHVDACGESGAMCASCSNGQVCSLGVCKGGSGTGGGAQSGSGGGTQSSSGGGTQSSSGGGTQTGTGGGSQTGTGGGSHTGGGSQTGSGGGVSGSGGGTEGTGGGSFGTGGGTSSGTGGGTSSGTGGGTTGTGGGTATGGPCTDTTLQCVDASGTGDYACIDATTMGFPANAPTCASDTDCPTNYHCWSSGSVNKCLQACTPAG